MKGLEAWAFLLRPKEIDNFAGIKDMLRRTVG
jgi:hypothetical protein